MRYIVYCRDRIQGTYEKLSEALGCFNSFEAKDIHIYDEVKNEVIFLKNIGQKI